MKTKVAAIRGDYRHVTLVILTIVFFFIYSFLAFTNPLKTFTWPDETANYFFITHFVRESSLRVAEPLNAIAGNIVHPRSINVFQGDLVPGTFLGFILLYGIMGKIFGLWIVQFLTPLLAALSGYVFYRLMRNIFDQQIAFLSGILYFILPPLWYYGQFTMLPNVAFISFIIFAFYGFTIFTNSKRRDLVMLLSGFSIGIAAAIRTNEVIWIGLVIFILWYAHRKTISWKEIFLFAVGGAAPFVPILFINAQIFGGALRSGYQELNVLNLTVSPEFGGKGSGLLDYTKLIFIPFGFHPKIVALNIYNYYISLFWWLFISATTGFFIYLAQFRKKKYAVYMMAFFITAGFLLYYYGSWVFEDQLTVRLNRIGISYVRYWLPLYILSLPFIALALQKAAKMTKRLNVIPGFLVAVFFLLSVNVVYLQGHDTILKIADTYHEYQEVRGKVLPIVPKEGIIITERGDKIFFPDRAVIGKWNSSDLVGWVALLKNGVPLYWYGLEQDKDIEYLNTRVFKGYPLHIENKRQIFKNAYLYDIVLWK